MNTTPITYERIDIERVGVNSLMIRKWKAGYNIADAGQPDVEEFIPEGSVDQTLADLEKQGYAVGITRRGFGRALKGPITRIDIILEGEEYIVRKYPRGWKAQTRPIETKRLSLEQGAIAAQWMREHGWTVIDWDGNYRGFKGKMYPVHDAQSIRAIRAKNPNARYNLAYYY